MTIDAGLCASIKMNVRNRALIVILRYSEGSLDDCGNPDPSKYLL
jgi:hypothetical protein